MSVIQSSSYQTIVYSPKSSAYLSNNQKNKNIKFRTTSQKSPRLESSPGKCQNGFQITKLDQISSSSRNIHRVPASNISNSSISLASKPTVTRAKTLENLSLASTFYIMNRALQQCNTIYSTHGYANFQLAKCEINNNGNIVFNMFMLIDQAKGSKQQLVVVSKIVQSARIICGDKRFQDFYAFYKKAQLRHICDFKYTLSLVKSYCTCSRIKPNSFIEQIQQQNKNFLTLPFNQGINCSLSFKTSSNVSRARKSSQTMSQKIPVFLTMSRSKQKSYTKSQKPQKKSTQISQNNFMNTSLKNLVNLNQRQSKQISNSLNTRSFKNLLNMQNTKQSQSTVGCTDSLTFNTNNIKNQSIFSSPDSSYIPNSFKTSGISISPQLSLVPQSQNQGKLECSKFTESRIQQFDNNLLQNQIFNNNNWTKTLQKLHCDKTAVVQSFIQGKDQQAKIHGFNPQILGKLARKMVDSYLPISTSRQNSKNQ